MLAVLFSCFNRFAGQLILEFSAACHSDFCSLSTYATAWVRSEVFVLRSVVCARWKTLLWPKRRLGNFMYPSTVRIHRGNTTAVNLLHSPYARWAGTLCSHVIQQSLYIATPACISPILSFVLRSPSRYIQPFILKSDAATEGISI